MIKKIVLPLLFLFVALQLNAKDVITRCDGEEIEAVVTEIGQTEVKYKKFNNLEGPVYVVSKSELFSIKYNVGTPAQSKEMFLCSDPVVAAAAQPVPNYPSHYSFRRKEPGIALLLSFIVPGGGQYYNGQYGKGAIMTGASLVSLVGLGVSAANNYYTYGYDGGHGSSYYSDNNGAVAFWLVASVGIYVWSMTDAVISAKRLNRENGFATWKLGNGALLSLTPDFNLQNPSRAGVSPSMGMGLKLQF